MAGLRDSIIYNGVLDDTSAEIYECRNALDSTVIWVRVFRTSEGDATFNLNIRPSSANHWSPSAENAVFWNEPIPDAGSVEKKVWIPLHDGDKIYMSYTSVAAAPSAFISGYQRTTT